MSDDGHDPALIGRTIAGKFVVEKHLGGGAMGAVYRARQTALEKNVAVKVLHREVAHDAQFKARFHREAKAASRLDHPNSMRVIDFGEEPDGLLYIAMEYLEGRDLYKVIHEDWPISDARIVDILSQALAAIAVAHDMGVIHRDLKPENIMVLRGRDDEGHAADVVKVCDFGIAKIQDAEDVPAPEGRKLTTQGLVVGTPEYMSPEQARGEKLDARSDIYSMGIILFQLLTGRTPFTGDNALAIVLKHITEQPPPPKSIYAGVNATLEAICLKAMAKTPGERFQSAREMRSALRASVDGRPTPIDASAPTISAPSAPVITEATTGPTLAELPAITTTNAGASAEAQPAPRAKRSNAVLVVALFAVIGAAAGTAVLLSKKEEHRDERTAAQKSAMPAASSNVTPPPPMSAAVHTALPAPHDPSSPPNDAKIEKRHDHAGKSPIKTVGVDTSTVPEVPSPPVVPNPPTAAPPEPPTPTAPSTPSTPTAPATTEAPPAPTPPPPPVFSSATCRANQGSIAPHGVSMKDLTMRGTADAWTACAKSTIKERPVTPISATVHIQFSDSRQFRGATCAGCPAPLAACVAANTGKTVSLQFKSGDVLGDPSFDVGVTFTCD